MLSATQVLITASLLLQETPAESAPTEDQGGPNVMFLLIALVAVFYFVMILPEKKNRKKREDMLGNLKKGDKVMTTSGIFASVATVGQEEVTLQVAKGVRMRFNRAAIQSVIDPDEETGKAKDAAEAEEVEVDEPEKVTT